MRLTMIVIVAMFCSCRARDLIGSYRDKEEHRYLELERDSTFKYKYYFDHFAAQSFGRWHRLTEDQIILNSNPPVVQLPISIEKIKAPESRSTLTIKLEGVDPKAIEEYWLYINDSLYTVLRQGEKAILIGDKKIKSLYVVLYYNFDYWINVSSGAPYATNWRTKQLEMPAGFKDGEIQVKIQLTNALVFLYPFCQTSALVHRRSLNFADKFVGKMYRK